MAGPSTSPEAGSKPETDEGALRHLWLSPWTSWVGFRYLKSKKNSRFLSFITFISMFGVMLGVAAMIVVLSVMDGFEAELKKRLMSSDLHILITPTAEVRDFDRGFVPAASIASGSIERLRREIPEIVAVSPVTATEVVLRAGKKVKGVVVKGIDSPRLDRLKTQLTETAEARVIAPGEGGARSPGLFIGQELAFELGVLPGDPITLISPTETEGPLNAVPRIKQFVVEGVYRSGLPEQEFSTVFASAGAVRSFLRKQDGVTSWEVSVKEFDDAPRAATRFRQAFPGFDVKDWVQLNSHLFASLRLERMAMFVILAFIVIVASFNIVTTLTLMVLEKKREIAIMRAMGARRGQIAAIFLSEGIFIGGLGAGSGLLLSWIACVLLKRYEFIQLPDVYYDRTLPVTFEPGYYAGVALCAVTIVLLACLYPSRRAARLEPLDGIRYG